MLDTCEDARLGILRECIVTATRVRRCEPIVQPSLHSGTEAVESLFQTAERNVDTEFSTGEFVKVENLLGPNP
jgi:hypothetical protein